MTMYSSFMVDRQFVMMLKIKVELHPCFPHHVKKSVIHKVRRKGLIISLSTAGHCCTSDVFTRRTSESYCLNICIQPSEALNCGN